MAEYWDKKSKGTSAPAKFVWVKKVERDLTQGKSVHEFTAAAQHEKHLDRMVRVVWCVVCVVCRGGGGVLLRIVVINSAAAAAAAAALPHATLPLLASPLHTQQHPTNTPSRKLKQTNKQTLKAEIEKVQRRREEREAEKERAEEVLALLQRQRLAAEAVVAEGKEEEFHLRQAQVRAAEIALNGVREEAKVGQRTTLDVLNAQQLLLNARVQLVTAQRDRVVGSYALLAAVGRLSAATLGLQVVKYDPVVHFDNVKGRWIGTDTPDGR